MTPKRGADSVRTFGEFRSGVFDLLAENDFSADYPYLRYDSVAHVFRPSLMLRMMPSLKISVGGNISSTAYNQARIGLSYERIGRAALTAGLDLYLGPIYNAGRIGGRVAFSPRRPAFLDLYYIFSVRNTLYGNFGNLSSIDNTQRKKHKENFMSLSAGLAMTKRSVVQATLNVGENYYRFQGDVRPSYFSFVALRAQVRRSTLDDLLWSVRGNSISLSGIFVDGRDKLRVDTYDSGVRRVERLSSRRSWLGARVSWSHYLEIPRCRWFSFGYGAEAVYTDIRGSTISRRRSCRCRSTPRRGIRR